MQPLNHGSICPTSGVAIARYTRGSMEDGPGVSINRTGGLSSPTCCVMTFCPSLFLRIIRAFESRTAREGALGSFLATAGTSIFAQSTHPRNRQIGWVCAPEASFLNKQIGNFVGYKQFISCHS